MNTLGKMDRMGTAEVDLLEMDPRDAQDRGLRSSVDMRLAVHALNFSMDLPDEELEGFEEDAVDYLTPEALADSDECAACTEEPDPEACPGCFCLPGDGRTVGCTHPDGCGFEY